MVTFSIGVARDRVPARRITWQPGEEAVAGRKGGPGPPGRGAEQERAARGGREAEPLAPRWG